ncbi:MAG: cation transporter, partial [Firmicutes bacterium]|nr:cation transporter [Bacillota bacterium]
MKQTATERDRAKQIINVSVIGILINILLVVFKAFVGLMANSIAIILDAVNNLTDALSSVITIAGTKLAGKAASKKHPYGHGRIEYLTSTLISVIVIAAGVMAAKESIEKIIHPAETDYTAVSIVIIAVAVAVKVLLGRYFTSKGKKLNSGALKASGTDALYDAILSFATLVSALINIIFHINLEGIMGAVISVFIIKAGIEIMRETLSNIIGARLDSDTSLAIKEKINSHEGVHGSYDLILHNYGPSELIGSVHIEVDDDMPANKIDELTRQITGEIYTEFGVLLTVGIYASNTQDPKSLEMKRAVTDLIAEYPQILQMHGFYVNDKTKLVSFDVIIDFKVEDRQK